jgi:hypothetical protein
MSESHPIAEAEKQQPASAIGWEAGESLFFVKNKKPVFFV